MAEKKPTAKKKPAKKTAAKKKPAAKKAAPRKSSTKRAATKKAATRKSSVKRTTKKGTARKSTRTRSRKSNAVKRPWYRRRRAWETLLSIALTLFIIGGIVVIYFAHDLPSIRGLNETEKRPAIIITTADGMRIASYGDVYGEFLHYEDIPKSLIHAVLATEDRRFFYHLGIDPIGITRALITNIRAGRSVQGGSTITQQVAKNVFLNPERTLKRKIQEALLAIWLEANYSKEEILAIYMNKMYLGSGTFGIDAAANRYYGKPAKEVNLMESAALAGLLKAPSRYSPLANPERSKKRAHQVLINMEDAGYIEEKDIRHALAHYQPSEAYGKSTGHLNNYRYFTDWIVEEIPQYIGEVTGDIDVVVTLDSRMQSQAETALNETIEKHGERRKVSQGALLAMSPSGAVRAMVGGVDYSKSQYNRATQAKRQPGSIFKLFVYLAGLEAGITPEMELTDEPIELTVNRRKWKPKNYANTYRGEMTVAESLTHSVNTAAVKIALAAGIQKVVNMAERLGIPDILPAPSIALGSVEASLLQMTNAFAHLASGGKSVAPYGITKITAKNGNVLYERKSSGRPLILRSSVVADMNFMLNKVVREGTGRGAALPISMAGKTGTSQQSRDAWFVGYTGNLVSGVWVGNDDNSPTAGITGGNLPARIWRNFMASATKSLRSRSIMMRNSEESETLPWASSGDRPDSVEEMLSGDYAIKSEETERSQFWDNLFSSGDSNRGESSGLTGNDDRAYPSERRRNRR